MNQTHQFYRSKHPIIIHDAGILITKKIFILKFKLRTHNDLRIYLQYRNNIPLFIYGFLFFILLRTFGDQMLASSTIWKQLLHWNHQMVSTLFGLVLIALGLSIKIKELKGLSYSSIVIGLIFSLGVFFVGIVLIPIVNYL